MVTIGYDNVVLIDSQVVLEAKPLDQLPWGDLFTGTILLLVTRQVQTEIDKRKNDGRLGKRARAFNKLLDGFIVDRVPSSVLSSPRVDVATVANRPIDWDAVDDLDRDDGDDRVVAQALNAIVDDPMRLVLLSHDMRPRDAATTHGPAAVKLPGRLKTWEAVMREDVPLMHLGLTKLHAQHRVRVIVENVGPISAEGLSLEIRSGNVVLHSIPYWVLVTGPGAPHPRMLYEHLTRFNPNLITPRREPFSFYWDERGPGDQLILSCASFRQEKSYAVEVSLELQPGSLPKAQVEAVVTASNMKGDARGRLLVDVRRVALPFDDAYNLAQGALELRPPFDLPDDIETDDYTWYRNGGLEYEPD